MKSLQLFKSVAKNFYSTVKKTTSDITHFAEREAQKPQVPVCLMLKNEDGTLRQATLSVDAINAVHSIAKVLVAGMWASVPFIVYAGYSDHKNQKIAYEQSLERYEQTLPEKLDSAITAAQNLSLDEGKFSTNGINSLPDEINWIKTAPETPGGKFYSALVNHKEDLMANLQIDSEKYEMLKNIALKIANQESKLGQSAKYKMYDYAEGSFAGRDILSLVRSVTDGDGTLSLGLTRMKIDFHSDEEKELYTKYGISYGDNKSNISNPEKCAIATMIHLAYLDKGFKKYQAAVHENKPDTSDPEVQKSIKNAQRIIFNTFLLDLYEDKEFVEEQQITPKQKALIALLKTNDSSEEEEALKNAGITKQDLEDIRTYASTVELSEGAYLAARWNGKRVIPDGDYKDIAVNNLVNVITQKGYIANIDKSSEIYY